MTAREAHREPALLPTTIVGSYPQPDWLIDRAGLAARLPPRVRARELWRVAPELLEAAQDDATRLAIADLESAGIDIVSDGEQRRESYSNRFATALDGVDSDNPGVAIDRTGHENPVPRVVGPIARRQPVEVRDVEFLRAHSNRRIKITLPGPFTMAQQVQDDFYGDPGELALAYAAAVNEEIRDLKAAGADVIQLDEPYLQARAEAARAYAIPAINRALAGIEGVTALHLCFGYAAIVHDRPSDGYAYLAELGDSLAGQISIETAQPRLDYGVLAELRGQGHHPRHARPRRRRDRDARDGRGADPRRSPSRPGGAPDDRPRLRHEVPAPRDGPRQAPRDGCGRRDRPRRARLEAQAKRISERIPSWASISSKPRLTSLSESVCETNGSTSISPAR